jgi:hypothetical protein
MIDGRGGLNAAHERILNMDRQGHIRLSTMEIVLVAAMLGMLLLGLLQAFAEERSRRASIETNHEH